MSYMKRQAGGWYIQDTQGMVLGYTVRHGKGWAIVTNGVPVVNLRSHSPASTPFDKASWADHLPAVWPTRKAAHKFLVTKGSGWSQSRPEWVHVEFKGFDRDMRGPVNPDQKSWPLPELDAFFR
jgi:hypothetical protein